MPRDEGHGDDLRDLIGVVRQDGASEALELLAGGLDEEEDFLSAFHLPLPPEEGAHPRQHIHARREALAHHQGRQPMSHGLRRARHEHHDDVGSTGGLHVSQEARAG